MADNNPDSIIDRLHFLEKENEIMKRDLYVLTYRESRCPTMLEAEARSLLRALQEIAIIIGLDPNNSSPSEIVNAVNCPPNSGIDGTPQNPK